MINKVKNNASKKTAPYGGSWFVYAILSALFAAATSILGKIGIENVDVYVGTSIRTVVVLIMAWVIVLCSGRHREIKNIDAKSGVFIFLSGLATGLSWLMYYKALQSGPASVVNPIDKLSIVLTVLFAYIFLHERLNKRSFFGLLLIVGGTLCLLFDFTVIL